MTKKLVVAVPAKVFIDWDGGIDFIIYIANGLAFNPNFRVRLLVPQTRYPLNIKFNDTNHAKEVYDRTFGEVIKTVLPLRSTDYTEELRGLKEGVDPRVKICIYENSERGFIGALRKIKADVVAPTTSSYGKYFPFPWVGYIWDFQHRYFPEYFNKEDIKGRNKAFLDTLTDSSAVIVNSKETKNDVGRFFKTYKNSKKIFSLPFSPPINISWLNLRPDSIIKKYRVKKPYFIICNQFWLHKSHMTALTALSYIVKTHPELQLVCTGKMEEPRDPDYIVRIRGTVKKLGLIKNVIFTGFIPKEEQISLMKGAKALIQPTLHEGGPGGGASYNAVSLGTPIIASDIAINKEMGDVGVTYFKAGSSKSLATSMESILNKKTINLDKEALITNSQNRTHLLSLSLYAAIDCAIKNFQGMYGKK